MDIHSFRPYQRFLTRWLFVTFLVVGIIGSSAVYIYRSRNLLHETQDILKQIASNASENIPVDELEKIQKPDDDKTPAYTEIVERFRAMIDGNPHIDDIYTLRPTSDQGMFTFVVTGQETADQNGDGLIDESEVRPGVGEEYDATEQPRLQEGLVRPSADDGVTVDKWGSWISGYAPIKDANARIVGVLGVDYSSAVMESQRWQILRSLIIVDIILLPIIFFIAYFVARFLSRPYTRLARAMYDVAHGDIHKQLPVHGRRSDRVFAQLFNGMVQMIGSAKHHENDEK
jgi:hypothetical protein